MADSALLTSTVIFYYISVFAISAAAFLSYKVLSPGLTLDKSCVKINKAWYALSFLLALALIGFSTNGIDYAMYAAIFSTSNDISYTLSYYRIEPGYAVFNFVIRLFTSDARVFFFVMSFVFLFLIYATVYRMREVVHAGWAILAFTSAFFIQQMDLKRIYLAAAIVFFATPWIVKRQYVRSIITILLATSIHTASAIMLVPLFYEMFMDKFVYRRWVIVIAAAMLVMAYFLKDRIFDVSFSSRYINYKVEDTGFGIIQPLFHLPVIAVLFFAWTPDEHKAYRDVAFVQALASFVICMIGYFFPIAGRTFVYFMLPFMLAPSMCINRIRPGKVLSVSMDTVFQLLFFLYFCFRLFMMLYSFAGPDQLTPYTTIFGNSI